MALPTSAELAEFPGLVPWLQQGAWKNHFAAASTPGDLEIASLELEELQEGGQTDSLVIAAGIGPSSRRHRTRVHLTPRYQSRARSTVYQIKAECQCGQPWCAHAAAAIGCLAAIADGKPPRISRQLDPKVSAWLARLREAEAASGPQKAKPTRTPANFLAYCIEITEPHPAQVLADARFLLRSATPKGDSIQVSSHTVRPDPSRPPAYINTSDLPICARILERSRNVRGWTDESTKLKGAGWDEILSLAHATGRLFLGVTTGDPKPTTRFESLQEGNDFATEPSWQTVETGWARPILTLPTPTCLLIPTEPLRYIDIKSLQIGLLKHDLPPPVLITWATGPIVADQAFPSLCQALLHTLPDHPLPLPVSSPAKTLAGLAPTPILHITNVLVGIYQKRHVGGLIRFQYPGSPFLHPLNEGESPEATWFDGETRVHLTRDAATESLLARQLTEHGLTPLQALIPAAELNHKNRHSVVIDHPTTRTIDWLEFLDSTACQKLKKAGWIIQTDPKLNLTIHEVEDLSTALTSDPDAPIDWFQLDVTGTVDGQRVSLIPHIARAIAEDWPARYNQQSLPPETLLLPCGKTTDGHLRFPAKRFLEIIDQVRHLFQQASSTEPLRIDRLSAARVADGLSIDHSETTRSLAELGRNLRDIQGLPAAEVPDLVQAELRPYQTDGFRWLSFLASHGLHGILADDMGLGKTLQTLAHLAARHLQDPHTPSLVIAPTSVVPNWASEAARFTPSLRVTVLEAGDRADHFADLDKADLVITSYPLLVRDFDQLASRTWNTLVLDEAQTIKNPRSITAHCACKLRAGHRLCLSGTPMENHLGELWSLMRFLMPGFLPDEKTFSQQIRKPIERDHDANARLALSRRIAPLILRRTKDQVAADLPEKTTIIHGIDLTQEQSDLYESVRAAMDRRVREAIDSQGLAKSHILVLDALLKLRQICCHPQLLTTEAARRVTESAKLEFLTGELLPTLLEEGRRILLFSQFTSMLELIEEHLKTEDIPYLKLTGETKQRATLVRQFQEGKVPLFLISLKAGGTGLNLTAADTVIHYDPWWNPAAENQATDRAHRIGQQKPVFVHKLVCRGTIEDRILELQKRKAALVEALLSEETTRLRIDADTLSHLLAPIHPQGQR